MDHQIALLDSEGFTFNAPNRFRNRSRKHVYWCTDTFIFVPKEYDELFNFQQLNDMLGSTALILITPFCNVWADKKPYAPDYFAPTVGNVLHVLKLLQDWSNAFPEGIWRITEAL
jgi:hypothetical protein